MATHWLICDSNSWSAAADCRWASSGVHAFASGALGVLPACDVLAPFGALAAGPVPASMPPVPPPAIPPSGWRDTTPWITPCYVSAI